MRSSHRNSLTGIAVAIIGMAAFGGLLGHHQATALPTVTASISQQAVAADQQSGNPDDSPWG